MFGCWKEIPRARAAALSAGTMRCRVPLVLAVLLLCLDRASAGLGCEGGCHSCMAQFGFEYVPCAPSPPPPPPSDGWFSTALHKIPQNEGNALGSPVTGTLDQCKVACLSNTRCWTFTYNDQTNQCYLKDKCGDPANNGGLQDLANFQTFYLQCWPESECPSNKIRLQNRDYPTRCVHTVEGGMTDGTKLHYWTGCDPGQNTDFTFARKAAGLPNIIMGHEASGKCWHSSDGEADQNGRKVHLWTGCAFDQTSDGKLEYRFEMYGRGSSQTYMSMVNVKHGKALHPDAGTDQDGAKLQFWDNTDETRIQLKVLCG